jgi:hypothetical protein
MTKALQQKMTDAEYEIMMTECNQFFREKLITGLIRNNEFLHDEQKNEIIDDSLTGLFGAHDVTIYKQNKRAKRELYNARKTRNNNRARA